MPKISTGVDRLPSGRYRPRVWDAKQRRMITGLGTYRTNKEAKAKAIEVSNSLARGMFVDPTTATVLDVVKAHGEGRAKTWGTLAWRLAKDPAGEMRVQDFGTPQVQAWLRRQSGAPSTQRLNAKLLSAALTAAVEEGLLASNPFTSKVRKYDVPRVAKKRRDPLTVEQVRRIAGAVPERYRAMVIVMAAGGLRIGEAVALRVDDVDFETATLHVTKQHDAKGLVKPLKANGDARRVPLAGPIELELARHIEAFPSTGLLFTSRFGLRVDPGTFRRLHWHDAVIEAKLPPTTRMHDLRHHCASTLLGLGVPITAVAEQLGHSVAVLSMTYAHVMSGAADLSRMAMESAWSMGSDPVLSRDCHAEDAADPRQGL